MASNIDIVRTGYDSFIRGDIQTTLAMFAEDIEWHEPEWTYGPASGDFCGRDEVLRRIFAPIPELNDAFALEPREFYCDGDTVIVTGMFHVTPKGAAGRGPGAVRAHLDRARRPHRQPPRLQRRARDRRAAQRPRRLTARAYRAAPEAAGVSLRYDREDPTHAVRGQERLSGQAGSVRPAGRPR